MKHETNNSNVYRFTMDCIHNVCTHANCNDNIRRQNKMNKEEINLENKIKLVPFLTKGGIYVYQNGKLVGSMTKSQIVRMS